MSSASPSGLKLLLVEPDSLMRRTVAGVSRILELARMSEAATYEAAQGFLETGTFDGLIVALADDGSGMHLIESLRAGHMRCATDCPVVVMASLCDAERAKALLDLRVRRIILKPFKVKTVLDSVAQFARA